MFRTWEKVKVQVETAGECRGAPHLHSILPADNMVNSQPAPGYTVSVTQESLPSGQEVLSCVVVNSF
jgi:hypothetical protein